MPNIRSNVGNKVIPPSNVNMEAVVRTIWGRLAKMKTNALAANGTIDSHKDGEHKVEVNTANGLHKFVEVDKNHISSYFCVVFVLALQQSKCLAINNLIITNLTTQPPSPGWGGY